MALNLIGWLYNGRKKLIDIDIKKKKTQTYKYIGETKHVQVFIHIVRLVIMITIMIHQVSSHSLKVYGDNNNIIYLFPQLL